MVSLTAPGMQQVASRQAVRDGSSLQLPVLLHVPPAGDCLRTWTCSSKSAAGRTFSGLNCVIPNRGT